jgi:hypothetical protein
MDSSDPGFDEWLTRQEAEADRVKRMGDYREGRQSICCVISIRCAYCKTEQVTQIGRSMQPN